MGKKEKAPKPPVYLTVTAFGKLFGFTPARMKCELIALGVMQGDGTPTEEWLPKSDLRIIDGKYSGKGTPLWVWEKTPTIEKIESGGHKALSPFQKSCRISSAFQADRPYMALANLIISILKTNGTYSEEKDCRVYPSSSETIEWILARDLEMEAHAREAIGYLRDLAKLKVGTSLVECGELLRGNEEAEYALNELAGWFQKRSADRSVCDQIRQAFKRPAG